MLTKNDWTLCENLCQAKLRSPTLSNRFRPIPLGHLRTLKKCVAQKYLFCENYLLDKFWPDHMSNRFRPFIFLWTIDRINSVHGRLIQYKRMQTMTLMFMRSPRGWTAPNIASWPWHPPFCKNAQTPGAREIGHSKIQKYKISIYWVHVNKGNTEEENIAKI